MNNNNKTNLFKTSRFLNNIYIQNNLYTELVSTKHIEKAMHLAETMFLDLPDDSLIKNFILETSNKPVKVTGFINSKGNLESNNKSVLNTDFYSFRPSISKLTGVYLFTDTLTNYQYIGSTINFQDRMPMHFNEVRRPLSKFHKFVSKNT